MFFRKKRGITFYFYLNVMPLCKGVRWRYNQKQKEGRTTSGRNADQLTLWPDIIVPYSEALYVALEFIYNRG